MQTIMYKLFYHMFLVLGARLADACEAVARYSKYNSVTLLLAKTYYIAYNTAYRLRFGKGKRNVHMCIRLNNDMNKLMRSAKEALS